MTTMAVEKTGSDKISPTEINHFSMEMSVLQG